MAAKLEFLEQHKPVEFDGFSIQARQSQSCRVAADCLTTKQVS